MVVVAPAVVTVMAVVTVVETASMLSVLRPTFFMCSRKKSMYNRKYSRKEYNQQKI
jgi:hypothetical protein